MVPGGPEFGNGPKSVGGPELGGGPEFGIEACGPLPVLLSEGASGIDTGPIDVGPVSVLEVDPPGMLPVLDDELLPGLSMLDDELPIDGISLLEDDDDDPKSLLEDDEDDPESLLGDGGDGSPGDSGNDTGPGATAGSGRAFAFAIAGPNRTKFTSMPAAIAAVRTRCFVVMMRLPVNPSDVEITKQACDGAMTWL
jgi:hypothetical protein